MEEEGRERGMEGGRGGREGGMEGGRENNISNVLRFLLISSSSERSSVMYVQDTSGLTSSMESQTCVTSKCHVTEKPL